MTQARIQKIIADQLGISDPNSLKPETNLVEDLEADSLDAVEMIMAIEDEFGCEIPDELVETFTTIGEIVDYVETHRKT